MEEYSGKRRAKWFDAEEKVLGEAMVIGATMNMAGNNKMKNL